MPELQALDHRGRWQPLGAIPVPVSEVATVVVRGLQAGEPLHIGPVRATADPSGVAQVRLLDQPDLRCQLGLISVRRRDEECGEIEVLPDRLTQERFERLRAELQSVWTGLVFDPDGTASLRGTVPDPRGYWAQLAPLVRGIVDEPRMHLDRTPGLLHAERARRPSELNTSVVLAGARNRAGRTQVVRPVPVIADHAIVSDTLVRLANLAAQHPRGAAVRTGCRRLLAHPLLHEARTLTPTITHGVRHDHRYRQVARLRNQLRAHLRQRIEGPGDLRHGIKGIDRLYEYWVYLSTIRELIARFGPPVPSELEQLVVPLAREGVRLELLPGTTVRFANGAMIAFEPLISTDPRESWMGLELAPNPKIHNQRKITPDTIVWLPGQQARLLVIDAKHRGRHLIDEATIEVHAKYARIRHEGKGIVADVIVAHPHPDLHLAYAGYRAQPFVPGEKIDLDELLPPTTRCSPEAPQGPSGHEPEPVPANANAVDPGSNESETVNEPRDRRERALIIIDQRATLPFRGMDLQRLVQLAAPTAREREVHVVMPDIAKLIPFVYAVERLGFTADRIPGLLRSDLIRSVVELVRSTSYDRLVLATDDVDLIGEVGAFDPGVAVFDHFSAVPPIHR